MKVTETRIVVCTSDAVTGGPEVSHQLVHLLRGMGRDASIAYYPFNVTHHRPTVYDIYDAPQTILRDEPDTFVLVPEIATELLRDIHSARTGVWWLSVDNYFGRKDQSPIRDFYRRWRPRISGRLPISKMRHLTHFAQSEYARSFLTRYNIEAAPLSDFLREDHLAPPQRPPASRRDQVAFNPRKGQRQTKQVIDANPDITFIPIEGMTPSQTFELLSSVKIYMDFGHHPGKDRLPREAAMAGCCVVTGRKGSAAFHKDVPIPARYKLDDSRAGFARAFGSLAQQIFTDFERCAHDFDSYRAQIRDEPEQFRLQIEAIFL